MTVLEMLKMNHTNGNQDGNITLYSFGTFDPALHFLVQKLKKKRKTMNSNCVIFIYIVYEMFRKNYNH